MNLLDFYAAARRLAWLVALTCLLGAGLGAYLELRTPQGYVAKLQLYAANPKADNVSFSQAQSLALVRMDSYVRLASTEVLATRLATASGSPREPARIADGISASVDKGTVLLNVVIKAPTEDEARSLATAMPDAYTELVNSLTPTTGEDADQTTLTIVDGPYLSRTRSLPAILRSTMLGLLLGLAAGAALVAVRARFQRGVRTPDALRDLARMPVVGVVPHDRAFQLSSAGDPRTRRSRWNAYRRLSINLRLLLPDAHPPVVVVTGPKSEVGTSATVCGLGAALAANGQRTLLFDTRRDLSSFAELGELRSVPSKCATPVMAVPARPGLFVAGLAGDTDGLTSAIQCGEFDAIVVDLPPLLTEFDRFALIDFADTVLLVCRQRVTSPADVTAAANSLFAMGAPRTGALLNRVEPDTVGSSQLLSGLALFEPDQQPAAPTT